MELIIKDGNLPDSIEWGYIENRHIIRLMYDFAGMMWTNGQKENAFEVYSFLLKSNPNDNLGVRYALVALLDGVSCIYELNDMFTKSDGYGDWEAQEKWFLKTAKKYKKEIGWWFQLNKNF